MKKYIKFLGIICFFLTFSQISCTNYEFHYGDKVKVIKGLYKDCTGNIEEIFYDGLVACDLQYRVTNFKCKAKDLYWENISICNLEKINE